MKKSLILLIIVTAVLFSCKESNKSLADIVKTQTSDSLKDIQNKKTFDHKDIYTEYKYIDSSGRKVLIQNGFPRGGEKYTDINGDNYNYAVRLNYFF